MKVTIKDWHAVAHWRWATGKGKDEEIAAGGVTTQDEDEDEEDLCGICRVPFEGCCPNCKVPGDDCPLIHGKCTHVFHMHCLLKWIESSTGKQLCPMDRRPWGEHELRDFA
ncbi:hypothetical protein FRB95_000224 [Tulasnella sp. JGI-2019a]|nr:hypothetical protein FRB95_000224 [Tulasnella sp. JGI-2019a]